MKPYLLAIVIVVIMLLVLSTCWNTSANEQYMYGFWVAEGDDFCEASEISSMMVFIGEPVTQYFPPCITRTCYIVIMDGLCNQSFTINYWPAWTGISIDEYKFTANVAFDEQDIWPQRVKMSIDMRDGVLKVSMGDTMYARLNKQHDTTNVAKLLSEISGDSNA